MDAAGRLSDRHPLSRWYLQPVADRLAGALAPTKVRPSHVTLCGLVLAMSAAAVLVRDMLRIVTALALLILVITPVFYAYQGLPEALRDMTIVNPFHQTIEAYRSILFRHELPGWGLVAYLTGLAGVSFVCGLKCFRRLKGRIEMAL